jgi:hypothetical protein
VDAVHEKALTQTVTSLGQLVTDSKLKSVVYGPDTPENQDLPFAWVQAGPDERNEFVGIPGNDREIEGVVVVEVLGHVVDETMPVDAAQLVMDVHNEIEDDIATYRGLNPPVYPVATQTTEGPELDLDRHFWRAQIMMRWHN